MSLLILFASLLCFVMADYSSNPAREQTCHTKVFFAFLVFYGLVLVRRVIYKLIFQLCRLRVWCFGPRRAPHHAEPPHRQQQEQALRDAQWHMLDEILRMRDSELIQELRQQIGNAHQSLSLAAAEKRKFKDDIDALRRKNTDCEQKGIVDLSKLPPWFQSLFLQKRARVKMFNVTISELLERVKLMEQNLMGLVKHSFIVTPEEVKVLLELNSQNMAKLSAFEHVVGQWQEGKDSLYSVFFNSDKQATAQLQMEVMEARAETHKVKAIMEAKLETSEEAHKNTYFELRNTEQLLEEAGKAVDQLKTKTVEAELVEEEKREVESKLKETADKLKDTTSYYEGTLRINGQQEARHEARTAQDAAVVNGLRQEVAQKEEVVEAHAATIDQQSNLIEKQDELLLEAHNIVKAQNLELDDQDALVKEQEATIRKQAMDFEDKDHVLNDLHDVVNIQKEQLHEKDALVDEQQATIAKQAHEIEQQYGEMHAVFGTLKAQNLQLDKKDALLKEHGETIRKQAEGIKERDKMLVEVTSAMHSDEQKLHKKDRAMEALQRELEIRDKALKEGMAREAELQRKLEEALLAGKDRDEHKTLHEQLYEKCQTLQTMLYDLRSKALPAVPSLVGLPGSDITLHAEETASSPPSPAEASAVSLVSISAPVPDAQSTKALAAILAQDKADTRRQKSNNKLIAKIRQRKGEAGQQDDDDDEEEEVCRKPSTRTQPSAQFTAPTPPSVPGGFVLGSAYRLPNSTDDDDEDQASRKQTPRKLGFTFGSV